MSPLKIFAIQATGLRIRYFAIILTVLTVATTAAVFLYSIYLKQERIAFIDQQVRETATAIVESELADMRKFDFDQAEEIISDELGESRIGKFFIIKNDRGEILYESSSAALLPIKNLSSDEQWFELVTNEMYIRGLNLKLPRFPDRTLQVGLVLDESLVNPDYLSRNTLTFMMVVVLFGLVSSFLLTSFLLRPISQLATFLSNVAVASRQQVILPPIPDPLSKNSRLDSHDEFKRVIAGLSALINKVNRNYQFSRLWAHQMAHELKTPLSLAQIEIERLQKRLQIPSEDLKALSSENLKMAETINSFLGWAELENASSAKNVFRCNIATVFEKTINRLQNESDLIEMTILEEAIFIANPQHVEQLVQNILKNALTHARPNAHLKICITEKGFSVKDNGPGIPAEVLSRLGEPFNRGNSAQTEREGHGLGLAWITSICRLYNWKINFNSSPNETEVTVENASASA